MRRTDREITDPARIREILEKAKILHLGILDEDGPYVVPLHYGCEYQNETLVFYMHCAREGHKLDLIRRDPRVCVQLDCDVEQIPGGDVPCRYGSAYASIIARGQAQVVEDPQEALRGLRLLMRHQTGKDFDFTPAMAASVAVLRVRVDSLTAKGRAMPR